MRRPSRERTRTTEIFIELSDDVHLMIGPQRTVRVDSAGDAVRDFEIQLRDHVFYMHIDQMESKRAEGKPGAPGYTLASLISRTAALSTMLRTVKRLMALSLPTQREQFEQRTKLTWPRPFLLRPPERLFLVYPSEGSALCTAGGSAAAARESSNAKQAIHPTAAQFSTWFISKRSGM